MGERETYDMGGIVGHVNDLSLWLSLWENREEPDAAARMSAADAVGAIDGLLLALHDIRGRLTAETRAADDAAGIRADALLADRERERDHLIPLALDDEK